MVNNIEIDGRSHYYKNIPERPVDGDIYAVESDGMIRAYVFVDDEWMLVTNMSAITENRVNVEYSEESDEVTEEIEQLDYQYRIGVL